MDLFPGFDIVDYQATPSGYYQIAFRSSNGTIVATQHGRGVCNMYSDYGKMFEEFKAWLASNDVPATLYLVNDGFPDLAKTIRDRGPEWYDIIVMSMCDWIEMGVMSVRG